MRRPCFNFKPTINFKPKGIDLFQKIYNKLAGKTQVFTPRKVLIAGKVRTREADDT